MFDARSAKALEPGAHLTIDGAPGLRLVATASFRTWAYRYRSPVDGRMRQIRLGRWPAMGLASALVAWQKTKEGRDAGGDPAAEKRAAKSARVASTKKAAYTVQRACDEYLSAYRGTVTEKTYGEAARLIGVELGPIASLPAASLTRADAFDLIDGMRSRPVLALRMRQLLGSVWDRALDSGRLPQSAPNWWRLILRGRISSKGKIVGGSHQGVEKRVLTDAELARLIPWLPNFPQDVDDALTLYLWTLCRGSEIMAMTAEEIHSEGGELWWTIPREKLKMRRNPLTSDLRVPLIGKARGVVERRRLAHPVGFLFPSRVKGTFVQQKVIGVAVWSRMPECTLRPEWGRARLPVSGWAPHDLRRTGRTMLAAMGCPTAVAEALLGHLPPGIQGVYNLHDYDRQRVEWLTRLSARLDRICAGQGLGEAG